MTRCTAWLTEEMRQRCWDGFGPHSAQEPHDTVPSPEWLANLLRKYPRLPEQLDSMDAVRRWIDGYDTGIRYADTHVGYLLDALAEAGVLNDTLIIVSSDHGENQGELNVWGDHQTADHITSRVPLIVRPPARVAEAWGLQNVPRVDRALHYHFDWAATLVELLGGQVPDNWDARPFTEAFRAGSETGRDFLVVSQAAWSCQRTVRFEHEGASWLCMRTYHDGYKDLEPVMLFNLSEDPHEQHDLSRERPDLVALAMGHLMDWQSEMMLNARTNVDPMLTVLREGGPLHTRGVLPAHWRGCADRTHRARRAPRPPAPRGGVAFQDYQKPVFVKLRFTSENGFLVYYLFRVLMSVTKRSGCSRCCGAKCPTACPSAPTSPTWCPAG